VPPTNLHAKNVGARGPPNRIPLAKEEFVFNFAFLLAKKIKGYDFISFVNKKYCRED
jgi:hypothetical protein